ncbi:MAG: FtsW/RodA/SpoVE family cell cycle protein [Lachnospiraceae bacterium]|nr:FtsW/RodA/SpoVE family cell cycle protein [Lachnospiraceae bacterium]
MNRRYHIGNYSFLLAFTILATGMMGIMYVTSADPSFTNKQILGLCLGTTAMVIVSLIDYNKLFHYIWFFYGANVLALLAVLFVGKTVGGAQRWFAIGGLSLQPSEFAKIIMILFVAYFIREHEDDLNEFRVLVKLALFCAIPLFLVVQEPDLSTTLDITFILCGMIFVGGLNLKFVRNILLIAVPVFGIFIFYIQTPNQILLKDYQVNRIMSFIEPEKYSNTTRFQQDNSVMAIGSGQIFGKGLDNNTISESNNTITNGTLDEEETSDTSITVKDTELVSEQQTDFIFSVIGEEKGFVGCMIVIGLLAFIVVQCIMIANRAGDTAGKLIAVGMAGLICFQSFINIGVATAILPNTGLPLPFISYGPTSLVCNMTGMGLVLNVGLQRRY